MDELECFRKAAELGCPDFEWMNRDEMIFFKSTDCGEHFGFSAILPYVNLEVHTEKRMNRYAAAVCAEWWRDHADGLPMFDQAKQDFCIRMINAARDFGKKYGAAQ